MHWNLLINACCLSFFWCASTYCNLIWPAVFISAEIYKLSYLVIVSILIESLIYYLYLNINPLKAMLVTAISNGVSFLVGTQFLSIAMIGWHFIADRFTGGTFNLVNYIVSFLFLYLGTCLIELLVVRILLRSYTFKQLAPAVFIGNLITYLMVIVYNWAFVSQLFKGSSL
jgi:hypothetical protein